MARIKAFPKAKKLPGYTKAKKKAYKAPKAEKLTFIPKKAKLKLR